MPKGLVVYLDDDTYRRFKILSVQEGQSLKDFAYDIIKATVDSNRDPEELLSELERQKTLFDIT